jgi:hypothetical protein
MTESPPPAETRGTVRARRLARRIRRSEWRQSCFELVSAGHSYAEVAKRLTVSERTVRRDVARVIDERRLDAPDNGAITVGITVTLAYFPKEPTVKEPEKLIGKHASVNDYRFNDYRLP